MRPEDLLLEWLSEAGSGTWDQFRESWAWLLAKDRPDVRQDDPVRAAGAIAANLSALGYLEIDWSSREWRIARPVVTLLPNSGGRALLTGARTREFCRIGKEGTDPAGLLADACEQIGMWPQSFAQRSAPSTLVVALDDPSMARELAQACEIGFSHSVSEQLSRMLPGLALSLKGLPKAEVPQGFEVERFSTDRLRWEESSEDEVAEPGLSRVHTWKQDLHLLTLANGRTVSVPRQHGVFEVLRWENRRVFEYDHSTWELWTPRAARLPLLQERAVVLCSGVLARDEKREGRFGLKHYNVPPDIARRVAEKLDQEIGV